MENTKLVDEPFVNRPSRYAIIQIATNIKVIGAFKYIITFLFLMTILLHKTKDVLKIKCMVNENKNKVSLVLEGGGMRGAYTAGCLAWLIDNNVHFDGAYGISAGAVHLTSFLWGRKDWLYEMSTRIIPDKKGLGFDGFLKERAICAYNYKFSVAKKEVGFTTDGLKSDVDANFGLYDLNIGKTIYKKTDEMNDELLKASCSLPILANTITYDGHSYLDGGITDMIPVKKAIEDGYTKHLVITTKAKGYIRKKTNPIIVNIMKLFYRSCPSIGKDYAVRAENYYDQVGLVNKLADEKKVVHCYPSENMKGITRLGGEPEDLIKLFNLGYSDMEAIKEDIFNLFK